MLRNKKIKTLFILTLILVLCASAFSVSYGATAAEKRKEANEAAKKAAEATKNFEAAEEKLGALQKEIEDTEAEIEQTKKDMKKKQKEIDQQENDLNLRLTAMYKTGTVGFVDVILSSEDIQDLVQNIGMVQKILEHDQNLLEKLQEDYEELEELKGKLEDEQIALEAKKTETEALKKKYKEEADKYHQKEMELIAEANALAAEAASNAGNAEELIRLNGGSINTTNYCWPTQMNYKISSAYGWRICPFHGKEFHNGLDIVLSSGTYGSPVYAIADGVITRASWYGGYGNCITITCGGGISALYGHLSGYNCKAGNYVNKGDVIGYIGSTGNSTGPHLHFTVFSGSSAISPWSLY